MSAERLVVTNSVFEAIRVWRQEEKDKKIATINETETFREAILLTQTFSKRSDLREIGRVRSIELAKKPVEVIDVFFDAFEGHRSRILAIEKLVDMLECRQEADRLRSRLWFVEGQELEALSWQLDNKKYDNPDKRMDYNRWIHTRD